VQSAKNSHERQRRGNVALPVWTAAAGVASDLEWQSSEGQQWLALPAAPQINGIVVIDDLVDERRQQQLPQQAQQQAQALNHNAHQHQWRPQQQREEHPGTVQRLLLKLSTTSRAPSPSGTCHLPPAAAMAPPTLNGMQSREAQRQAAKQHMAAAAQQLLQDPDKHLSQLRSLLELLQDKDAQVVYAHMQ